MKVNILEFVGAYPDDVEFGSTSGNDSWHNRNCYRSIKVIEDFLGQNYKNYPIGSWNTSSVSNVFRNLTAFNQNIGAETLLMCLICLEYLLMHHYLIKK
tara:strand:+ start:2954 stop:3250 length:297 start_codon:yes stop_codon:yes gene_type:complete